MHTCRTTKQQEQLTGNTLLSCWFRQERLQFFLVPKSHCQFVFERKTTPEWHDDTPVALVSVSIISPRNTAVTEDKLVTIRRRRNWLLLPVTGNTAFPAIVSSCRQSAVSSTECGFFGHRLALSLQIHQLGNLENGWWVWGQCDRASWHKVHCVLKKRPVCLPFEQCNFK